MVIDLKSLPHRRKEYEGSLFRRGVDVDLDLVLGARERLSQLSSALDACRAESKSVAGSGDESGHTRGRELRAQESELSAELASAKEELHDLASHLPNFLDPRVPIGGDDEAIETRRDSPPTTQSWQRPHDEVANDLGWLDVPRATTLAGSRFYVLKNEAVLLRHAMTQLFLDTTSGQRWTLVSPPVLSKRFAMYAAGYLPFNTKDNFEVRDRDLTLIGTSEQALLGMHEKDVLDASPVRYLGESMCFRTEAGSHGRDVRGMLRVHQFFKLEQFVFCAPEQSEEEHLLCLTNQERFLELLELPSRTIICASHDVAAPGYFKYDVECWFPVQGRFREVTSNTNLLDFQTRRASIRMIVGGRRVHPHTISATAFCDRHIAALIENHQQKDGTVAVPDALRPYMHGSKYVPVR